MLGRTLVLPDLVEGKWMASHATNRPREPVHYVPLKLGPSSVKWKQMSWRRALSRWRRMMGWSDDFVYPVV